MKLFLGFGLLICPWIYCNGLMYKYQLLSTVWFLGLLMFLPLFWVPMMIFIEAKNAKNLFFIVLIPFMLHSYCVINMLWTIYNITFFTATVTLDYIAYKKTSLKSKLSFLSFSNSYCNRPPNFWWSTNTHLVWRKTPCA